MERHRNRIKVLYTIPNFDTAGSGRVLYDLAKNLDKENYEIEVACNHNRGLLFPDVKALGLVIHLIELGIPYRPYYSLLFRLWPLVVFFKSNKYDIIHSWHWSSDWTEALAARIAGVKWIYTKKSMSWGNIHWKIRSRLANYVVTINDEMRLYFPNRRSQELIPIGIDTNYYSSMLFRSENKDDAFQIITVANLVKVKGIEVLLKAIALFTNVKVRLIVVGDTRDPYADELKSLCKELSLDSLVQFLGKENDVRKRLAASDLFVIPTLDEGRKEGMPMALVEAMSMGIPVLGSDISGIKFVLADFPQLLFKAGDSKELSDKVGKLMRTPRNERLLLGKHLRNYCVMHFSIEKFIASHEALYTLLKFKK